MKEIFQFCFIFFISSAGAEADPDALSVMLLLPPFAFTPGSSQVYLCEINKKIWFSSDAFLQMIAALLPFKL